MISFRILEKGDSESRYFKSLMILLGEVVIRWTDILFIDKVYHPLILVGKL